MEKDSSLSAYFTRKMFLRAVLPSPLAGVGLALAEMGDTILIGHAIGMNGIAAIAYISPLFLLATFFVFGLSTGGAVVFSTLMHEGEKDRALAIFNFFLRLSCAVGFGITGGLALIGYLAYHRDTLGGGDVKLFTALGLICGPWGVLFVFVASTLLAAAHFVALMARGKLRATDSKPLAPYIAVTAATYLVFFWDLADHLLL